MGCCCIAVAAVAVEDIAGIEGGIVVVADDVVEASERVAGRQ